MGFPENVRRKIFWAETGEWETVLCANQGLSANAFCDWILHQRREDIQQVGPTQTTLTSTRWHSVVAFKVAAGDAFQWHARCDSIGATSVQVNAGFLLETKEGLPQISKFFGPELVSVDANAVSFCKGSYQVRENGRVFVETMLQGS